MPAPVLRYTLLRLVMFLGCLVLLRLVGVRGFPLVVLAIFVSAMVSLVFFARQRDEVAGSLADRARRARERLDRGAASEDD